MTQVLENDKELYVTTNCNSLFENFSDKKAKKTIVNLIGLGILVNRYQSGSQSRDLDRSGVFTAYWAIRRFIVLSHNCSTPIP